MSFPSVFPSVDRAFGPRATVATASGVFLAYASSVFLALGLVALVGREWVSGLVLLVAFGAAWRGGHWLANR